MKNAPSFFQVLKNVVFKNILSKSVSIFTNDIVIYNSNMVTDLAHVKVMFALFKKFQLCAEMPKWAFVVAKVEYFGHFISVGMCFN